MTLKVQLLKRDNLPGSGQSCELLGLPQHQLSSQASQPAADLLNHRCLVCNFWTPDRTKVKSHFRQAHPGDWARLHPATARLCQAYSTHTMKSQQCPFCHFKVHDRRQHPEQCPVLYQVVSYWLRARTDLQKLQEGHSPAFRRHSRYIVLWQETPCRVGFSGAPNRVGSGSGGHY